MNEHESKIWNQIYQIVRNENKDVASEVSTPLLNLFLSLCQNQKEAQATAIEFENCECGHRAPREFVVHDDDNNGTCPNCQREFLEGLIEKTAIEFKQWIESKSGEQKKALILSTKNGTDEELFSLFQQSKQS